ncbi:reprolysin-like metallopeptidase [Flavobacterium sp.]|uniref:zinc-dependent metalloprotease n=1 Tax=Flavobacterium sp. TaxID=239 RepID=UPI0028BF571F|nr:zinc-dependent metalloprotease family protein [Flavobacterium sp.]
MKKILLTLSMTFLTVAGYSQSSLWTKTTKERVGTLEKFERATQPNQFELFHLNFNQLKNQLVNAPLDLSGEVSSVNVMFPDYTGKLSNYAIYEAPVMEKGLADQYPDIKSYVGKGLDDKSATIRFSVTSFGLHVMMTSGEAGTYYIDTYTKDLNNYIIYSRKDLNKPSGFSCHLDASESETTDKHTETHARATDGVFRQYRLAMACTVEYATFHVNASPQTEANDAEKIATVLAAMNVTMTRVNGIYERDMSLRMNLVANNNTVIFVNTDSFDNDNAGTLINQSQTVINGAIGNANYDIGHTVSTGGGGLAGLGVVCVTGQKARGITGSPSPVGDPYDIDYVAHEIGHQFGGPHTFSSNDDTTGNCDAGNVSSANAVEPGSGSTIMAYAGICEENVQSNSDSYFHAVSIASMNAHMIGTGNCAPQAANGNNAPVISPLSNYTIPRGTAFVLTGSATDANAGAALTYCWEQTNAVAGTNFPTAAQTTGPVYRSFSPTSSPSRYFPRFADVLSGNLTPTWEVTPNVGRTLNFALTVRDNQTPTGGQTARANMTVTTVAAAGPFAVTAPAAGASWNTNSSQNIMWNVAGTTANGINTANVNILLSTDNGVTFNMLLANTPNDGNQMVTMPSTAAPFCRIMVQAVGNVYYAITSSFSIGYTVSTTCNTYTNSTPLSVPDGTGANVYGAVVTNTINVPNTGTISQARIGLNVAHTYPQDLQIAINHPDATQVMVWNRACAGNDNFNITLADGSPAFSCVANMTGTFAPSTPLSVLNGKVANGVWTLLTRDGYNGDTGSINSWFVEVCTQTITLNTENFGLENFSIYPNPNNGNFTVQFDSKSGNDVKIGIHDIRGRLVFDKSYQNTGVFNQNIQLNSVESGVYMVTVQDGDRKEVKKIVIK